ncbi:MAG: histidine--tRNA ligase [Alphaproteobacteria bacterium]|nr:histidine--tRNA ligase [Alphaproteobacteria bacterium]
MNTQKKSRPKARVAKGFRDIGADEIRGIRKMLATIQGVYENYGFEPVEQPFIEYTDALGKFLPDQDRPNAGVFSFQDEVDDLSSNRPEQWLSLRYDLTAPLARYVAENFQKLPTPFRSYRQGWVFRNEKPGPGRFRQFMQFDADTVGSASPAADAEVCMMAADTMEALGIERGQYVLRVYNRKVIDGIFESIGLSGSENASKRLTALRAIDKLDKFGIEGVKLLLGNGRKDESGDFTKGAELDLKQIDKLTAFIVIAESSENALSKMRIPGAIHGATGSDLREYERIRAEGIFGGIASLAATSPIGLEGMAELRQIWSTITQAGYSDGRIRIDPSVIRGLEYYTGPVFECELLMETKDEDGKPVRFGSVGGGGRYDDLVARFTGQQVPATGFSIGVSRLYSALKLVGKAEESTTLAPVIVTVMDKDRQGDYWRMVQQLRQAGIRSEMSLGAANMGKQMKYADKRGSPLVVIQGGDEKAKGEVTIKDLRLGEKLAAEIETREEYASQRLAQVSVPESELVAQVKKMLGQ